MKHTYEQMIIEGTRLLGLKPDGKSESYGSYIRIVDTGETCYACANGQFFEHDETQRMADAVAKKMIAGHHQTDSFYWKPIKFPVTEDGIDYGHFIFSNPILSFPMKFWGNESYLKQIAWIEEKERKDIHEKLDFD